MSALVIRSRSRTVICSSRGFPAESHQPHVLPIKFPTHRPTPREAEGRQTLKNGIGVQVVSLVGVELCFSEEVFMADRLFQRPISFRHHGCQGWRVMFYNYRGTEFRFVSHLSPGGQQTGVDGGARRGQAVPDNRRLPTPAFKSAGGRWSLVVVVPRFRQLREMVAASGVVKTLLVDRDGAAGA